MSKKILSTLISTTLLFSGTSALAAQIDGAVNADNRFMVVLSQNGINTVVYTAPSNYTWGREATRFSFDIEQDDLKQCKINIINWGDNRVAEGFAGVLKGANGAVYSGGSNFTATESSIPSGGFSNVPSQPIIDQIVPAMSGGTTDLGSTQGNSVWGSVKPFYTPSDFGMAAIPLDFNWIRPAGTNKTTNKHFVYTTDCSNLVDPKPVAVHMPGEHFQCYDIRKANKLKPETIYIKDQFGESKSVLGTPRMLCNPSLKVHNKKEYGIRNAERHLVCYDYVERPKARRQNVRINNQFAPDDVLAGRSRMFCVPSSKKHLDEKPEARKTNNDRNLKERERPAPIQQRR